MMKRVFYSLMIVLFIGALARSAYFYTSLKTNVDALNATSSMIQDVLSQRGLLDSFTHVINNLFSILMIETATFFASVVALIFLLWFIFRLYLIEHSNALIDPLTGIYNRRAIMLSLDHEKTRAERFNHKLSAAVIDVDFFKNYNDLNGHKAGDKALKKVAKIVDKSMRRTDFFGRIGGEEFMIVFPETKLSDAQKLCERIRLNVLNADIDFEENMPQKALTISIGVAEMQDSEIKHHNSDVFDQADKQLYIAKLAGRNCVR